MLKPLSFFCLFIFQAGFLLAQQSVTFVIQSFPSKDSSEKMYITGNFANWVPDDPVFRMLPFDGQRIIHLDLPKGNYEYKFTRGNWLKGESDASGTPLSNRSIRITGDTTVYVSVAGWSDQFDQKKSAANVFTASKNVRLMDSAFYMPQLNRYRRIWIYLPEDYETSSKRYPVLYMHDGQNLFDNWKSYSGEWGIDEFLDSMFVEGKKQVIVIGIDNGQEKRMQEYNPWTFQNFGEGQGHLYADFLVQTLKPFVDAHYRTKRDKKHTAIAGSSMGGLISLYTVLRYPKTFGSAGIFSPAFWTASGIDSAVTKNIGKVRSKLFFYAGGKEGETMIPDMLRVEGLVRKLSKAPLKEIIDMEAKHNEAAWRKHFPAFYHWVYGK